MRARGAPLGIARLGVVCILGGIAGCGQIPQMRGEIEGLRKVADQAERNGALRCAPRQLAMAKSHLEFAELEIAQGFFLEAKNHLATAEANAQAAYELSPPQKCAERGFVVEKPPPDDPDTDGDGILDTSDSCVLQPEDADGYLDEDGCPDVDNDLDTIPDARDKCVDDPEDPDAFEDDDGCPDLDNDQDKLVDLDDPCPNEAGPLDGDPPGCPLVVVTDTEIKITQQIHFQFDKAIIRPESFGILDAVVAVLEQNPKIKIEIQGHTDNVGSAPYNKQLSDRRAGAVLKYLVSKGIDESRLTSKGYGMERPIRPNDSPQNRALNRRVQFVRTEKD